MNQKNHHPADQIKPEQKNTGASTSLRSYSQPKIISTEDLEATAATCSPAAPPYGKTKPSPCGILGS